MTELRIGELLYSLPSTLEGFTLKVTELKIDEILYLFTFVYSDFLSGRQDANTF